MKLAAFGFLFAFFFSFFLIAKTTSQTIHKLKVSYKENMQTKEKVDKIAEEINQFSKKMGMNFLLNSLENDFFLTGIKKNTLSLTLFSIFETSKKVSEIKKDLKKLEDIIKGISFEKISDDRYVFSNLNEVFFRNEKFLEKIEKDAKDLEKAIFGIEKDLEILLESNLFSESTKEKILDCENYLKSLKKFLEIVENSRFLIKEIFGIEKEKLYLVLFQNISEKRPTGGFIGSFALLKVSNGEIAISDIGSSYKVVSKENIEPPEPIKLINQTFEFRDGNYFFETKKSAETLEYLFGEKLDSIIFVNSNSFEEILKVSGPIFLDKNVATLTEENFYTLFGYLGEIEYKNLGLESKESKNFLKDVLNGILKKVEKKEVKIDGLARVFLKLLNEKDIVFSFKDEKIDRFFGYFDWNGINLPKKENYLALVETNIGGFKTSVSIEKTIEINSFCKNGILKNEIKILYRNMGKYNFFEGNWRSFERAYLPNSANVEKISGIDSDLNERRKSEILFEESLSKVVGYWIELKPNEEKEIFLSYEIIGIKDCNTLFIRQPGEKSIKVKHQELI